ncbi:MAG: hypothetical protein NC937_06120 [Candidatus Omnitrophica bacterium]|nr:hypothetical protein [Candidatus Omnitrophota bacterium]MCM8821894.1 hypothetical protein [Candidatus Omnitrophota bacterium]MCM8825697.1 hypothetical protein [Candidatus Omnitrophota bacterium]MCM8829155.1 hypothetical protein [Candidatus Omnitrophota bacterium]
MRKIGPLVLLCLTVSFCFAEEFHISSKGIYFFEEKDVEWHINFNGKIPTSCGFYFILFDANGKALYCDAIPSGDYSENPYTITIPRDNITGCYKGVIVGKESVSDALSLPLSDLKYEVYGGDYFAASYKGKMYFQVRKEDTYVLGAYKGHLKVLNEKGETIADTRETKKQEKYDNLTEFSGQRGINYILQIDCRYFRVKNNNPIFLSNIAEKLFIPDEKIDSIEWWKIPLSTKEDR